VSNEERAIVVNRVPPFAAQRGAQALAQRDRALALGLGDGIVEAALVKPGGKPVRRRPSVDAVVVEVPERVQERLDVPQAARRGAPPCRLSAWVEAIHDDILAQTTVNVYAGLLHERFLA
jgi:hypothetical protein